MDQFKASLSWVHRFKKRHNIVSRNITKVVPRKEANPVARAQVSQILEDFRSQFKDQTRDFDPDFVFNTDQSGFNLELLSTSTLKFRGAQKVHSTVKATHSMTHSYTVQFLISKSGLLLAPVLTIFQEKDGKFGKRVLRDMLKLP